MSTPTKPSTQPVVLDAGLLADLMAKAVNQSATVSLAPEQFADLIGKTISSVQRPENPNPPVSTWNGYGREDFPALARPAYFCGGMLEKSTLTRDETSLLNQIRTSGLYGPDRTWAVTVAHVGQANETVEIAIKGIDAIDTRMSLPSLKTILQTIVSEQAAH